MTSPPLSYELVRRFLSRLELVMAGSRAAEGIPLRAIEPTRSVEKHEARRCPSCGRWYVGAQARILREILAAARIRQENLF